MQSNQESPKIKLIKKFHKNFQRRKKKRISSRKISYFYVSRAQILPTTDFISRVSKLEKYFERK